MCTEGNQFSALSLVSALSFPISYEIIPIYLFPITLLPWGLSLIFVGPDFLTIFLVADFIFFGPKAVPNTTTCSRGELSHLNRITSRQLPLSLGSHFIDRNISSFAGIDIQFPWESSAMSFPFRSRVKPLSFGNFSMTKVWLNGCGFCTTNGSVLMPPTFTVPKDILGTAAKCVNFRVGGSGSGERGNLGKFLHGLYHWARFEWTLLSSNWGQFSLTGVRLGFNMLEIRGSSDRRWKICSRKFLLQCFFFT